jgi:hypothetical protein
MHERPAVLLVGRRVHRDEARAVLEAGAEITAEACVFGCGGEGEARAAKLYGQPALESIAARVGVYD